MDPRDLPEDLSGVSDEELGDLLTAIRERAEEIAAGEDLSAADIEEIIALAEASELIEAEVTTRAARIAERRRARAA